MTKKLTEKQMVKRDERIRKLYSKVLKSGKRKYSVRSLAEYIGLSKSRVHEIIREGSPEI